MLEGQKKFGESSEVLESVLEQDPDNSEAHFQLGTVCWSQERYAAAADEFRKSLAIEPGAARGLFNLAKALELAQPVCRQPFELAQRGR